MFSPSARKILFSLLLFFSTGKLFSQNYYAGGGLHYGFVMAHRQSMKHLITGHTKGFELNLYEQTSGKRSWEQLYLYPEIGVKFYFADLGNPQYLGFATGAIPYIYFPFFRTKKVSFGLDLGTSYGYVSKRFNPDELHKNIAIGSHINGMMHGMLKLKYNLSPSSALHAGIVFTHFSNGAFKVPNLGINIPTISVGYSFALLNSMKEFKKDSLQKVPRAMRYSVTASAGLKEVYDYGSKKYPTYTISGYALKPIKNKTQLGFSANIFYNTALGYQLADSAGDKVPFDKVIRFGFGIPFAIEVSRFTILLNIGMYLKNDLKTEGNLYQRFGFNFRLNEHLYLSHMLKIHFGKADNIEVGLGYKF